MGHARLQRHLCATGIGTALTFAAPTVLAQQPAANLDQLANGSAGSPVDPGQWQNGNLNENQAHYLECHSVPYRVVMTNLPLDTLIVLTLEYDIRHSDAFALDHLTHHDCIDEDPAHAAAFGHDPETIDPLDGTGLDPLTIDISTCDVPAPPGINSPVPGVDPMECFNQNPCEKAITLFGGTFVDCVTEMPSTTGCFSYTDDNGLPSVPDLSQSQASQAWTVCFKATSETAVLAWGGHIAAASCWGDGNSASAVNGSPYHTRILCWNLNNIGNQDRSLAAAAVTPPPAIGACCLSGNACQEASADVCAQLGGDYLGDNSMCATTPSTVLEIDQSPGVAIPDDDPSGVSDTITVAQDFTIIDADIDLDIDHTFVGDLVVTISHGGVTVTIVDRPGVPDSTFGCGENNYQDIIIDDDGTGGPIEDACTANLSSPPNYTPANPLSAFDGMSSAGDWTITVSDNVGQDTGTLNTWSLHLEQAGPLECPLLTGACCVPPPPPQPTEIVFCLDVSGSIDNSEFQLILDGVKACLAQFPLDGSHKVGIVTFGSSSSEILALTQLDDAGDVAFVESFLTLALNIGGSTNIAAGINSSISVLQAMLPNMSGDEFIILVGDGQSCCGAGAAAATQVACALANANTIGICSIAVAAPQAGQDELEACANATGGTFHVADTFDEFEQGCQECLFFIGTGSCFVTTSPDCIALGGSFQGDGSVCTAPVITCPPDVTVECGVDSTDPSNTGVATAVDDDTVNPTISFQDGPIMTGSLMGMPCEAAFFDRTWTAEDGCFLVDICVQRITLVDTTDPEITCPADVTAETDSGQCGAIVTYAPPTVMDDCPGATFSCSPASGEFFGLGATIVTCSATDACGNTSQCTFTVTVNDTEDPTIACPGDVTVEADAGCDAVATYAAPVANDNCPGVTSSCSPASGSTFGLGTTVVTCTATDAAGNTASCDFTVRVIDTTPPTIDCPVDVTVGNDPGACGATVTFSPPTATDACPNLTVVCTPASGSFFPVGTTNVSCTATDTSGNQSSCMFSVTVNDTEDPTVACPADVTVGTVQGGCTAIVNYAPPSGADNCPGVSVSCVPASGSLFTIGTTEVTCTATDAAGNTATCTFDVTVEDTQAPAINCPADIVVGSDAGQCGAIVNLPQATPVDNCPGVTVSCAPGSGFFPVGVTPVTCTATDVAGNTATCTFNVTVNDTENPTIACPADIVVANDALQCGATVNLPAPTAGDNCPGVTVSCSESSGFFAVGTTMVTCTATDAAGNTATCQYAVTVNDTEDPTVTCPADITVDNDPGECSATVAFSVPVFDNCPGVDGSCTFSSGAIFPVGTTPVSCTVTDASGNTAQCSFSVTVNDTENPVITCPADIVVSNDPGACGAVVNFSTATATDNCAMVSVQCLPSSGSVFDVGTTMVTCTAIDGAGNSAQCTFSVTVDDTEIPTIACPADVTIGTGPGMCGAVFSYNDPTANDNCPGVTVSCTPASGAVLGPGTTTITCTATDGAGNTAQCSFDVTVEDDDPPTVDCPTDVVVDNDAGACGAVVNYPAPAGADDCPGVSVDCTPASGSFFVVGTTVVTCTATDAAGNTATCTFDVTVNDTETPTITCPADVTAGVDSGQCAAVVSYATPTGADNCPGVTVSCSPASGTIFNIGPTVVTCTVTDAAGNSDQCMFTVTVVDDDDPTITCPADIVVDTDAGVCGAVINYQAPAGADHCPGVAVVCVPSSGTLFPLGDTTVTCTATDAAGNTATCAFTVTVNDGQPPTIACPADVTVECDADRSPAATGNATATDACDDAPTVGFADVADLTGCGGTGTVTRTWTATDDAGNSATCVQTITVVDATPPSMMCPPDVTVECDQSMPTTVAVATDNCDPNPSVTTSDAPDLTGCSGTGTIARTWITTDACGNSSTCVQTITVVDTTPPVITCAADVTVECGSTSLAPSATATDNCGTPVVTSSDAPTSGCGGTGVVTRTWTATDECGNTATCVQTITTIDTTPPELTCPMDVTIECDADSSASALGSATATDSCDGASPAIASSDDASGLTGCAGTGTLLRTWTATDGCGNSSTCVQTITIVDTTPPVLTCAPDVTIECGSNDPIPNSTATDNCGVASVSPADSGTPTCGASGIIARTWTATDLCGNTATCVQTIFVVDTTPPMITCPADVTIECDASSTPDQLGEATATDACTSGSTVAPSDDTSGLTGCAGTGTLLRTWTATDPCGNTATCVQTITIVDTTPPVITCAPDVTVECAIGAQAGDATATDNCGGPPVVTFTDDLAPGCGVVGTITRTWIATDDCGNTSTCIQIRDLVDTTPPEIECPDDVTVECDAVITPDQLGEATATDLCGGTTVPTTSSDDVSGLTGCNGTGTILRTWTATDGCGNSATCVQTITLVDTTTPVITCPRDVTVECDDPTAPANTGSATATDNCGPASVSSGDVSSQTGCNGTGTITRTWTATDACGNSSTCVQTITLVDTTPPTITCPADVTIECDETSSADQLGQATATDACTTGAPAIGSTDDTSGLTGCAGTGTLLRTWTATDECGNSATCVQTITIVDSTPPEITCPPDVTIQCSDTTDTGTATATDNCGGLPAVSSADVVSPGPCPQAMTVSRTWTATDDCGNTTTCVQTIFVVDTIPPNIMCPPDVTIECVQLIPTAVATATDNCDPNPSVTTMDDPDLDDCSGTGAIARTWIATDACGNSSTCVQTITVVDTTSPDVVCPPDVTVECDESTEPSNTGTATATDDCGIATVESTNEAELTGCNGTGTIVRTWTATDECGNTAECVQTITVVDTTPPEITCPPDVTVECGDLPSAIGFGGSDNCSDPTGIIGLVTPMQTGCNGTGTFTRTFTVTDGCGHSSTCVQTITIVDTTPPEITCPADVTVECGGSTDAADTGSATADDVCGDQFTTIESSDDASGLDGCSGTGTILRTWTATDACGNSSTCVQTIVVEDATGPVLTCPDDVVVPFDPFRCGAVVGWTPPTVDDVCDDAPELEYDVDLHDDGVVDAIVTNPTFDFPPGTHRVTARATDDCGNVSSCVIDVEVGDQPRDCLGAPLPDCFGDLTCEDCNGNGLCDLCEIAGGTALDLNGNLVPDACEVSCCGDGDITLLILRYTGEGCGASAHGQSPAAATCTDFDVLPATAFIRATPFPDPFQTTVVWFEGIVDVGASFPVNSLAANVPSLTSTTWIHVFDESGAALAQTTSFNTECEEPLTVGDEFGAAQVLRCYSENEPLPCSCCPGSARPALLTLKFTGEPCEASEHLQEPGENQCTDFDDLPETVFIRSSPFADPDETGGGVWFEGLVNVGGLFSIDAAGRNEPYLTSDTWIHVFDEEDGTLLQQIQFHTSCSQPTFVGDAYGSVRLLGCIDEDGPTLSPEDDCNANGVLDAQETAVCADLDCDANCVPDVCQLLPEPPGLPKAPGDPDENDNGVLDVCELAPCIGDTNFDGVVDVDDVINVVLDFDTDGSANNGDVDGNGIVDVDDNLIVVLNFGPCPGISVP